MIHKQQLTKGSEQTITISGASSYNFYGVMVSAPSVSDGATITIKDANDVTYVDAYVLGFPNNFIPSKPGITPVTDAFADMPSKSKTPHPMSIKGPVKITLSGNGSEYVNIYYDTL